MLQKKVSLLTALLIVVVSIAASYFLTTAFQKPIEIESVSDNSILSCNYNLTRLNGYNYIKPLLFADEPCEAKKLAPLKYDVERMIRDLTSKGTISTASVYVRQLNQGEWISINENEKYNPGSLLKVPELITFMKMNEKAPGLLDKKIVYAKALNLPKQAHFVSRSIEVGKTYSIRQLLYYMIAYSDNYATMILNQQMDIEIFKKLFSDMGLAVPDVNSTDIPITARQYSLFMRALYNATYLSIEDSEFCTELLSHSDFKKGMLNGLPDNLRVVHKFGEAGDGVNAHFSEAGIVYINASPYLVTIMTKGKNNELLPGAVSNISKKVFETMMAF